MPSRMELRILWVNPVKNTRVVDTEKLILKATRCCVHNNGFNMNRLKNIGEVGMSVEEYINNPLWSVLVETVHAMVMYPHHKAYVRDVVLHEQPEVTARDLAVKLGIPSGEALVILHELKKQNRKAEE